MVAGERSEFYRRAKAGEFVKLSCGRYIDAARWQAMTGDDRYLVRIAALVDDVGSHVVLSHESAAAIWRLPRIGPWPARVHTLVPEADGGRSNSSVIRHTIGVPTELDRVGPFLVTTLARTVVDIAATNPFASAVVMADAALRRTAHPLVGLPLTSLVAGDLIDELATLHTARGTARAQSAIQFADGMADRPGESVSRANMHLAKVPAPELQCELRGASGTRYYGDFLWREQKLVGEFDGEAKYRDPEFLRGRTPHQALVDEKTREDDLRAVGYRFSRWWWDVALNPVRLRNHLRATGLRW